MMGQHTRMGRCVGLIVFAVSLGLLCAAHADVTSYQGVLRQPDGAAIEAGTYSVTLSIYDTASGGSQLWSETASVQTINGAFSFEMGNHGNPLGTLFTDYAGTQLYLEVSADTGSGMETYSPRVALTHAPYAFHATVAETALSSGAVAWGDITGMPAGFSDGTDDVDDADASDSNELNTNVAFDSGTNTLTVTDAGGAKSAVIDVSADISAHAAISDAHHARYEDSEAVGAILAADGPGSLLDADTLDGTELSAIQSSITTVSDDLATHEGDASAHHTRYQDSEAVGAILAADGPGSLLDADTLDGTELSGIQSSITSAVSTHNTDSGAHTNLNLSGAQITSGTVNADRLPVGTGSTQVAAGDHSHAYATHFVERSTDYYNTGGEWTTIVETSFTAPPSGAIIVNATACYNQEFASIDDKFMVSIVGTGGSTVYIGGGYNNTEHDLTASTSGSHVFTGLSGMITVRLSGWSATGGNLRIRIGGTETAWIQAVELP